MAVVNGWQVSMYLPELSPNHESVRDTMTADSARTRLTPIVSEEVSFVASGRTIPGTLVHPESGAGPGLLLLAGSGPTDRDWNSPLLPGKTAARGSWPKRWLRAA